MNGASECTTQYLVNITHEAFSVIDQIRATGKPIVVLSGGEPLLLNDVYAVEWF